MAVNITQQTRLAVFTELYEYQQWVCFVPDKTPITPLTGIAAEADDPETWGSYEEAVQAYIGNRRRYAGIGFEFIREQRITGIDLDHCINAQGNISPYAQIVLRLINSYAERSPSRDGIHIWVRGNIPKNLGPFTHLPDRIEAYDHGRYFTITGNHVEGTPETIEERQAELDILFAQVTEQRRQNREQRARERANNNNGHDNAIPLTVNATEGDTPYGLHALHNECQELAATQEGGRNDQLNRAAYSIGQLVAGNELTRSTAENALRHAASQTGLPEDEIDRHLAHGLDDGMRNPRRAPSVEEVINDTEERSITTPATGNGNGGPPDNNGAQNNTANEERQPPTVEFILECLREGEYGDALLFTELFRGQVVYDHSEKEWYSWEAHYWKEDRTGQIKHLISGRLASTYLRAGAVLNLRATQREAQAQASGDAEEIEQAKEFVGKQKALIKQLTERAFSLRQAARAKNIMYFASSNRGMGITSDMWDRHPWALPTPNGVIDLKTGERRNGRPEDYIRTVSPTEWRGLDAPITRYNRFLNELFEDRPEEERAELISFLQRLLGYGITGMVSEHVFAVLFGEDGRNGKDTLQHALTRTLGEISAAIQKDVFLDAGRAKAAGSATPHLSDLQGKRLAWASEPEKGARFNIGQVKELSGGGQIPTRGVFERKITKIDPSHLLLLLTNHKPQADANDNAFWDRLRLITFNMRFVDNPTKPNERRKDTSLWNELEQETSGILAWLVRGCLEWQRIGLATPQRVLEDGLKYRKEEDIIQNFIEECCVTGETVLVGSSRLYEAYTTWCKDSKVTETLNHLKFGPQLEKKGFTKTRQGKGIVYHGIGLLETEQEEKPKQQQFSVGSKPQNVGSVHDQTQSYTDDKAASQADANSTPNSASVGSVYSQHKLSKNTPHVEENLQGSVSNIHYLHLNKKEDSINQPVEPSDNGMYDSTRTYTNPTLDLHEPTQQKAKSVSKDEQSIDEKLLETLLAQLDALVPGDEMMLLKIAGEKEKKEVRYSQYRQRIIQMAQTDIHAALQSIRAKIATYASRGERQ